MKNTIGILREGRSKRGEKRVAITPGYARQIVEWGHKLIVQSAFHPETRDEKRAFADKEYKNAGAIISEDLSPAQVIFGLKEIFHTTILPDKAYYFFSHTYKGQIKNRPMLKKLVERKASVIDYELISDEKGNRLITAFTYNAGYAGMVDTLWTLGKRLKMKNIPNAFELVPQAVDGQDLASVKNILKKVSERIKREGTPKELPPVVVCFLGKGKTAFGAREIFNILPHEDIDLDSLAEVFKSGSRKKLYALQLGTEDSYRLKKSSRFSDSYYNSLHTREKQKLYLENPGEFKSNLDKVLPYITILMNCIIWSDKYPRTVTKFLIKEIYSEHKTLKAIGDITCDPNGSIEFSKETWIDDPVYIYNPLTEKIKDGFEGEGVAVMAVTNLPCEFSADASRQFSDNLAPFLKSIVKADYNNSLEESNLPDEIKRAVILWKGKLTKKFSYMKEYLE
jgi:alanine dehydrogenase